MISTARQCGRLWAEGPSARGGRFKSIRLRPAVAASSIIRRVSAVKGRSQQGLSARRSRDRCGGGRRGPHLYRTYIIFFLDPFESAQEGAELVARGLVV